MNAKEIDWTVVEDILLRLLVAKPTQEEMHVITEAHLADARRYAKLYAKVAAPHLAAQ